MNTTSISLLERLRKPAGAGEWERFVKLYTPLIFRWGRQAGLSTDDASDLVQEVLVALIKKLPEFTYDPSKSFRAWLRTVTLNKWHDLRRARQSKGKPAALTDLPVPDTTTALDELEYNQHLVQRALQLMKAEFNATTWQACWEYLVKDRPVAEVARELD